MNRLIRTVVTSILAVVTTAILSGPRQSLAADAAAISRDAQAALAKLYETTPAAKMLGEKAKAVLVFPSIL